MITLVLSTLILGAAPKPLNCSMMGSPVNAKIAPADYNGVRFGFCCGGCDTKFEADPKAAMANAVKKGWTIGESLFDVTTGLRVGPAAKGGSMDYKGVRYFFQQASGMKAFKANPAKYAAMPTKDSLTCPVSHEKIGGYASAASFMDIAGARYYICCGGCVDPMKSKGATLVKAIADSVGEPKVANKSKNAGGEGMDHAKPERN